MVYCTTIWMVYSLLVLIAILLSVIYTSLIDNVKFYIVNSIDYAILSFPLQSQLGVVMDCM